MQFATFWIATAVGIYTLASIALGVASVVYAVKAYDMGLKQYQVAVWQFCLDLEQASDVGNRRWREFCYDDDSVIKCYQTQTLHRLYISPLMASTPQSDS